MEGKCCVSKENRELLVVMQISFLPTSLPRPVKTQVAVVYPLTVSDSHHVILSLECSLRHYCTYPLCQSRVMQNTALCATLVVRQRQISNSSLYVHQRHPSYPSVTRLVLCLRDLDRHSLNSILRSRVCQLESVGYIFSAIPP